MPNSVSLLHFLDSALAASRISLSSSQCNYLAMLFKRISFILKLAVVDVYCHSLESVA